MWYSKWKNLLFALKKPTFTLFSPCEFEQFSLSPSITSKGSMTGPRS